jgi:glycosyltransferase involved in cell wall biosynthesis
MIYLDVTSASASPLNMGVQRTVRGVYGHLLKRNNLRLIPLRWDFFGKRYVNLSEREMNFLVNPFASYQSGQTTPGRWQLRSWLGFFLDHLTRGQRVLELKSSMQQEDILFIPDLCWDRRIDGWSSLVQLPGTKVAIFHDAMPLRIPGQAESNDSLFRDYVRALGYLDQVICISNEVREDLNRYWAQLGVAAKPTPLVTWPVPFTGTRPGNLANQQTRHVIYVARLKMRKNHLVLLEACESLWKQGVKFSIDLIGVEDAVMDTLRIVRRVKALANQGYPVRWRKHISDEELNLAYQESSFTVFPSKMEGFGLPILESLWHGRPVICGTNGAIGEVAREGGGCLYVDQNNPAELATALQRLLEDTELYQELYDQAQKRNFRSWADYIQDLEQVLNIGPNAK